ncbi:hypothetical protein E4T66_05885 [Sinimarinibacterium sp. CAU 1509]|uniref:LVIVD repeat-containing protein n=1 Tax=Sinimarinibacterium sp. CAU 1509 TaxID=2562283 RepID=UPI0010AC16F4|nr:hypothetical protein [Sinimarinibacterium sp. CAU 1509]TJY63230.1 hypothetical protein E4T66_05885 [Sinimarinibacterium sp. CAU 1509]
MPATFRSAATRACLSVLMCGGAFLAGCGSSEDVAPSAIVAGSNASVPKARCGDGSQPETGLQGQVSREDRDNGRNLDGYSCNLKLVGQYQGNGASVVSPSIGDCAYLSTSGALVDPLQLLEPTRGVHVVSAADPAQPVLTGTLASPSFLTGTWESLKTNQPRNLLGGVAVGLEVGVGFFDVYDVTDCAHPVHLNGLGDTSLELPANLMGHEGNWAPDGNTYWATGNVLGGLTAIDVSEPATPKIVYTGFAGFPANHGVELSEDGNTLYLTTCFPGGVVILDVSEVQSRAPVPMIRQIGSVSWNPASCGQHALPVTWGGKPYLIAPDEFDSEGIHIIDISDPTQPVVVNQIQLEIQLRENAEKRTADTAGDGVFGYEAHYCTVDTPTNPKALACGYFQSGIRVFNVADPMKPFEIAYFNPPAQTGKGLQLQHSLHAWVGGLAPTVSDLYTSGTENPADVLGVDLRYVGAFVAELPNMVSGALANGDLLSGDLSADWCSSPPRFVGDQLWVTCMDNGFMVLEFTNGAYPIQ